MAFGSLVGCRQASSSFVADLSAVALAQEDGEGGEATPALVFLWHHACYWLARGVHQFPFGFALFAVRNE